MRLARLLVAALVPLAASPAAGWDDGFRLAPYLWIPSLTGTVGAPGGGLGQGDRIDVDLERFAENLRVGGAMVNLGWRGGRWIAYGDWTYANVRSDTPTSQGVLYSGVEAQIIGNIVQAFGGYTVLDAGWLKLDAAGGLRGYSLLTRLAFQEGTLGGRETSGTGAWVDGVAAVRVVARFGGNWETYLHADVGGGGSHLTWQLLGTLGYEFSWGGLYAGWRHLAVDYSQTTLKLDISLSGPIVGAVLSL